MITEGKAIEIFYELRPALMRYGKSKGFNAPRRQHEVMQIQGHITEVDIEIIIDDCLVGVLKSPAMKRGFESNSKLRQYLFKMVYNGVRRETKLAFLKSMPPLTDRERKQNFDLVRSIIDNNRING